MMATVESSNIADDQANNNDVDNDVKVKVEAEAEAEECDEGSSESNNNNGTSNESEDKTNLIVNYLPQNMTDEEFEDLFKKFGSMKSCKIVRNRVSGYSYGFGFVDFQTHKQAIQAIDELNGHELDNKKIKVAFARPAGQNIKQANLYIKNIPSDWGQDDVKKIFEPYGNIIQVRVLGNNRGVAFVLYDLRKQAEDALDALNGTTLENCDNPLEIKFAADKKADKGNNKNQSNNNDNSNNNSSNNSGKSRERGNRGGRFRNNRDQQRQGRQSNQRSFFDRQNNHDDRQQNVRGGQSQYNSVPYGRGVQYSNNFTNMNGVGPVRQTFVNKMNRFSPYVQQPMDAAVAATPVPMAPQMGPNPTYAGFPQQQQQMIPFNINTMAQQIAPMQQINPVGQIAQGMGMYGTAQLPCMGYPQVAQNPVNSLYSLPTNSMNQIVTMQPQVSQPMTMRNNSNMVASGTDEGVTLFVYNIGPDSDENELRSLFSPYGHVVKCNVVRKTPGGETKGFGFVTLSNKNQADSAISGLNGSMRNGRALQVSLKK